jgi:hypothetical protein
MEVRPYLVLGDRDRSALLARIETALLEWCEEWLAPGAREFRLSPVSRPQAGRWLVGDSDGERNVALGYPGNWIEAAGALLTAGTPPEQPAASASELAAQLAEAMLKDLVVKTLRSCSGADPGNTRWGGDAPPDAWLSPGTGATMFSCELSPAVPLVVALSPELVLASLPKMRPQSAARDALVTIRSALGDCPVTLEAVLGEADIELEDLSRLAAGDVIVLDRKLDDSLLLRLGAGDPVIRIQLGAADGKKAAQVLGPARA